MRNVRNTQKETQPIEQIALLMGGGGIEAQEARGQSQLVNSEQMPTECRDKEVMESWGVKFGEPTEGDDIFCQATLPEGWKKEPSDHSMWSYVVDENGRKRIAVFYKAAFYDRSAFCRTERRFYTGQNFDDKDKSRITYDITMDDKVIHSISQSTTQEKHSREWFSEESELKVKADAWLEENYPNHSDPIKSWEY